MLWCGPRCGGGLRSTFLALPIAPPLRRTRCAGILPKPPPGFGSARDAQSVQGTHVRTRCGYLPSMGCSQYPHGRDTPSEQRRNASPICACHSTPSCTGERGRARRSGHQDPSISTTDRPDQGPCTARLMSHQSHKARRLRQSRVVALQVGSPIYISIYLSIYLSI